MKHYFTRLAATLAFSSILFNSCSKVDSNDLDEDVPYYQHYSVSYDGSNNTTQASGAFRVRNASGTGITLSEESSLKINGAIATKDPIASIIIPTYSWSGNTISNVSFVLSKKGGQAITNNVNTSDIETVAFPSGMPSSFSRNNGINFSYVGNSGAVEVLIKGKNSFNADTSFTKETTTNQVNISTSDLNIFANGNIEIHLTRHKHLSVPSSDQNAGGMIDLYYGVHNTFGLN